MKQGGCMGQRSQVLTSPHQAHRVVVLVLGFAKVTIGESRSDLAKKLQPPQRKVWLLENWLWNYGTRLAACGLNGVLGSSGGKPSRWVDTNRHLYRHTDRHRQTDGQTDNSGSQTLPRGHGWQNKQTNKQASKQTNKQTHTTIIHKQNIKHTNPEDMGGACFRIGVLKNLFNHVHQCICVALSSADRPSRHQGCCYYYHYYYYFYYYHYYYYYCYY